MIHGGGHERGLRSGTLNVPGIVGFGRAVEIAQDEMPMESRRLRRLRRRLHDGIVSRLEDVSLNGALLPAIAEDGSLAAGQEEWRLPGNLNLSFAHVDGEALLLGFKDVAISSGSACTSASLEPSHVLKALGRARRSGALFHPIRSRAREHGGGDRLRDRGDRSRGPGAAQANAVVLDFVIPAIESLCGVHPGDGGHSWK